MEGGNIKIDLIPLASPIHLEENWRKRLNQIINVLTSFNFKIKIHECIRNSNQIERLELSIKNPLVFIAILTGGTSSLAVKVLEKIKKKGVIIAHNRDNSLPSAIETREKAKLQGYDTELFYLDFDNLNENEIVSFKKAIDIVDELIELKAMVVGKSKMMNNLKIGDIPIKIVEVNYESIEKERSKISELEVDKVKRRVLELSEISEINEKDLEDAIKLYLAIKKLMYKHNVNAVLFNCFNYIVKYGITPCLALSLLNSEGLYGVCESDIPMMIGMVIGKILANKASFMGNLSSYNVYTNTLILAHCTAPLILTDRKAILVKHFETGLSVSIDLPFPKNLRVTLISISRTLNEIIVARGLIVDSSMKIPNMCRTQIKIKLEIPVKNFIDKTLGNHHLVIFDDKVSVIEKLAEILGIKIISIHSQ